jgi:hypothetical protein
MERLMVFMVLKLKVQLKGIKDLLVSPPMALPDQKHFYILVLVLHPQVQQGATVHLTFIFLQKLLLQKLVAKATQVRLLLAQLF